MTTSTTRPRRGAHTARVLATACSLGLAGLASQAPALAAPVARPASPDGSALPQLPLQGPSQPTAAQSWVLTLDPKGPSARAVEKAAANANAMSSLGRDVADHVNRMVARHGAKVLRAQANANNRVTLRLDRGVDTSVAADLARNPQVLLAEPDITARPAAMTATPNDTYFGLQWGLTGANGIHADAVWPTTTGDGQRVAVLDTGITDHPDLAGRTVAGYDFVSSATAARDGNGRDADSHDQGDWTTAGQCGTSSAAGNSSWHGTHVASIVAATGNNGAGTTGVAPGAQVQPVRVLGACGGSSSDIADAITWASGGTVAGIPANPTPAKVVNLSLGGSATSCPSYYQAAIDGARSRGAVVVVAAGNSNVDARNAVPANCNGVVTVAATGETGTRAAYSNFGSLVEVAAPGGDNATGRMVVGAWNDGATTPGASTYAYMQGTSQATPMVAGTLALMRAANPSLTGDQLVGILRSTARPTGDASLGSGIVDAKAAVAQATSSPSPSPSTTASPSPTATVTPALSASATPAAATLTVPATARRGTAITVQVSGFAAAEPVDVTFDGKRVAQLRTDSTGAARSSWTVPSRTKAGAHAMAAKGLSSARTARATVQVS